MVEKRSDSVTQRFLQMDKDLHVAFSKIREEFEDHLTSINENTDEVNNVNNRFEEMDHKIEKLNTRLDTIHMMFQQLIVQTRVSVELSIQEQRIFSVLSMHPYLSLQDLEMKTALSHGELEEMLTALADKGIPIVKKTKDGYAFVKLDDDFRALQEKHQLVKVNPAIMQQLENKQLMNFFC